MTDPRPRGGARAEDAGAARRRKTVAGRRAAARRALDARAGSTAEETLVPAEPDLQLAEGARKRRRFRRQSAPSAKAAAAEATTGDAPTAPSAPVAALSMPVKMLAGVAAVVALVLLALLALYGYQSWQNSRIDSARAEALAAAQRFAPDVLSYDYRHLEQDFDKAKNHLTGPFAKEYADTTSQGVLPVAREYKAVVKAEVVASSVVSAKPGEVVTLLFINQTTTSTRVEGPKIDQNRVRMTLTEVDGEWKISKVDAL